jgi:hypothetical protein
MRFDYVAYQVTPSITNPNGIAYRPEVTLRLHGPNGSITMAALVDTGADEVFIPRWIAEQLGIELHDNSGSLAQSVTGEFMELEAGEIDLELLADDCAFRWRSLVSFAEFPDNAIEGPVLGHVGGLEFFAALLYGDERSAEIKPNNRFPGSIRIAGDIQ